MAENRSAYIVTEKGTYTANNQHFASYRPVIMSMLRVVASSASCAI
jgi:hypothetical protein